MSRAETWFETPSAVQRYVGDLVADELQALRPGSELPVRPWPAELSLGEDGLGCDSLETMALTAAVVQATHMHRSGIEDYLLARRTLGDWAQIVTASLERFHDELTFHTSGSTGSPTAVTHPLAQLVQEIREFAPLFSTCRRILTAVPGHHIYGFLFSVLLPAELELPVTDIRFRSLARLSDDLTAGDLIVGHPAFFGALSRAVPQLPAGVTGVTSTAPCPHELAATLADRGLARLVQIYGSTQTSGIGWRDRPDDSYRLLSYWAHRPPGTLVRAGANGESRSHEVPDRLLWTEPGRFRVEGRHDGVVQVGGINVAPAAIAARLQEHPAVAHAAVRAMAPDEGVRLKAFIVARDPERDHAELSAELTRFCDTHLRVAERPKAFTYGTALPANEMGKPADWPLPVVG